MMYNEKSKDELIELLEERDQKITELNIDLKEANQAIRFTTHCEIDSAENLEHAFYAGYNTINKPINGLKSWLNYKIMENIS